MSSLPDIQETTLTQQQRSHYLNWVGMDGIKIGSSIRIDSQIYYVVCRINVAVNLINNDKGIHMSRLYNQLQHFFDRHNEAFDVASIEGLCHQLVQSHLDCSDAVRLTIQFELPLYRQSLVSEHQAQQTYPVRIEASLRQQEYHLSLQVQVDYSSTCPCSAALSRQAIAQVFKQHFSDRQDLTSTEVSQWIEDQTIAFATPHSQRSTATITVQMPSSTANNTLIVDLINGIESTLKTPVQTAVKRADEQAFAELNGQNLMFCEDAARRLKDWLAHRFNNELGSEFTIENSPSNWRAHGRVEHFESLHKHNAVASFQI